MLDKRNFYISGNWVKPFKPNDFEVIDPSNEETCAVISLGNEEDVNLAVKTANESFPRWSRVEKKYKISLIEKLYKFMKLDGMKWQNQFLWKWALLLIGQQQLKHHLARNT